MEDSGSSKWPWWLIVSIVGGIGIYVGMVFLTGGIRANLASIFIDAVLFFVLLNLWLAFFSQFILPVQTFEERRRIFDRLWAYLGGTRGPAIFVRDGELVANPEEMQRRGPGVIWLDTASGAVTRGGAAFRNVFGPGVNFTEVGEYIRREDAVDLHIQVQRIGPREGEDPFVAVDPLPPELKPVQERGLQVSGLTRDGIEVVPSIEVLFKLDTGDVRDGERGSRFGFSSTGSRAARDQEAVALAVMGQAVDPTKLGDSKYHQVAWNELPALLAADLWREYLSHFRLDELFNAVVLPPTFEEPEEPPILPPGDADNLSRPVDATPQGLVEDTLTNVLRGLNLFLRGYRTSSTPAPAPDQPQTDHENGDLTGRITGLQMINLLVRARLTSARVPALRQPHGASGGPFESEQFHVLEQRGIRVLDVSIGDLRVTPKVDADLVANWTANWLNNARAERAEISLRRNLVGVRGAQRATREYAVELADNLLRRKSKAINLTETARILLTRSKHILLRQDRVEQQATAEREAMEQVIQWLEAELR